jgi:hypothetical protein
MKTIVAIVLSVAFLTAFNSFAKDASKASPFNETLAAAPAAELPATAADLVTQAKSRDRQATTINVVKSAVTINPAASPAIVGAIARAVPDMAPTAAGTAAAQLPKQAAAIAKAAAAAAPSKAGKIVVAVCRAVPNEYRNIAVAVSEAVPGSGKDILNAVAAALPGLKPGIEQTLATSGGNVASVGTALDQAARISPAPSGAAGYAAVPAVTATGPGSGGVLAPMVRGPAVGPPYIPLTTTPTNVTPGTSGIVPPGGRNYAQP